MRNREVGIVGAPVVDEQHIDVERPRSPSLRAFARRELLDQLTLVEQLVRVEVGLDRDDRVQVRVLRRAADRRGLVHARHRDDANAGNARERVDRELEVREPVAEVRAEREIRAHAGTGSSPPCPALDADADVIEPGAHGRLQLADLHHDTLHSGIGPADVGDARREPLEQLVVLEATTRLTASISAP